MSIMDCFYDNLVLGINNSSGQLIVKRNGTHYDTGQTIPDGQRTVLSLVVQSSGRFSLHANGTQVYTNSSTSTFTQIAPGAEDFKHDITVGRNVIDGWTTFNGNIGDVYVYKVPLNSDERTALETVIRSKFGF